MAIADETREADEAVDGAETRLCVRSPCPYDRPCPAGGLGHLLDVAPVRAVAVCLRDHRLVWRNSRAKEFEGLMGSDIANAAAASEQPRLQALTESAGALRDGISIQLTTGTGIEAPRLWNAVSVLPTQNQSDQYLLVMEPAHDEAALSAFESLKLVVAVTNDTGTVEWLTPAASRLMAQDVVGRKVWDVCKAPEAHRLLAAALDGTPLPPERVQVSTQDESIPFDLYAGKLSDSDPARVVWRWERTGVGNGAATDEASSLVAAMKAIAREVERCGFAPFTPSIPSRPQVSELEGLTERESTIVTLIARGLKPAAIGERLFLSPSAVRNHLSAIYRKLGVKNQAGLLELLLGKHIREN